MDTAEKDVAAVKKALLCLAIIIAMIFSGMYSADAQIHSMLSYAHSETSEGEILASVFRHSTQILAEEFSGLRSMSEAVIQNRRVLEQNSVRAGIILLVLAVLLTIVQFFMVIKRMLLYHGTDGIRIIIRYIHHQDGQKG